MKTTTLLIILSLIIMTGHRCLAQEKCGTIASDPPEWIFKSSSRTVSGNTNGYIVNIFVHMIRSSAGEGDGVEVVRKSQETLNKYYSHMGILFNVLGYDYIDNDRYCLNLSEKDELPLLRINGHTNAIDIYVLPDKIFWKKGGLALDIPSTAFIIEGLGRHTTLIAHEMGHCLGLYHTHHGTRYETGLSDYQCAELVDGSNSLTCGDYIEDTPADPFKWSECTYNGTLKDANGQAYHPDPLNIMSYASSYCRDRFSPKQEQRIKDFIANTPALMATTMSNFSISGASYLSAGETYSVDNLPAGAKVTWTINSSYFSVNAVSNSSAKVYAGRYNVSAILKASVSCNNILIKEITKTLYSPELNIIGNLFVSGLQSRYSVNYLPPNATLRWSCAPGIEVKKQNDNYIIVTACKTANPWIQATVTVNGITTGRRLDLRSGQLTGMSLELLKTWRGKNANGQNCKKYAFKAVCYPQTIPVDHLTFCWRNTVQKRSVNSLGSPGFIGQCAKMLTEGTIGYCVAPWPGDIQDSLIVGPGPVIAPNAIVPVQSFGSDEDLMIPYEWGHSTNCAIVEMPSVNQITTAEEFRGRLTCMAFDYCGNGFSQTYTDELWDSWQPVYHIAPNPVDGLLTVAKDDSGSNGKSSDSRFIPESLTLNLYSDYGIVRSVNGYTSEAVIQMNTADLPAGSYYLNILKGGCVISRQLVVVKH